MKFYLLLITLCLTHVFADTNDTDEYPEGPEQLENHPSGVPHINMENFDKFIKKAEYLVLFTYDNTNRCKNCENLLLEFKAAGEAF